MTPIRKREDDKREAVGEGKAVEEETAVVALSSPFSPPSNNAAAPIEQRRLEAQRHRHGEVWTKDPHGGRHRPAGPSTKGLDPLTHAPTTGQLLPLPPPGFERPLKVGPTTNFVGDAMLGVPLGLIASKLAAADARAAISSTVGLISSSSTNSSKPLPLAAPAKKLLLLQEGKDQHETSAFDAPPVIERYDLSRAREVAAALLGRRLPKKREQEQELESK